MITACYYPRSRLVRLGEGGDLAACHQLLQGQSQRLLQRLMGAAITLVVTAWTLRWLLRDSADARPREQEQAP